MGASLRTRQSISLVTQTFVATFAYVSSLLELEVRPQSSPVAIIVLLPPHLALTRRLPWARAIRVR